jgi:hypothetical protein
MKIQLRNKSGEFCTLQQLCEEAPRFDVSYPSTPRGAYEKLEEVTENTLGCLRLLEIAEVFDLPKTNWSCSAAVALSKEGCVSYWGDSTQEARDNLNKRLAKTQKLASVWQATEYEIQTTRGNNEQL